MNNDLQILIDNYLNNESNTNNKFNTKDNYDPIKNYILKKIKKHALLKITDDNNIFYAIKINNAYLMDLFIGYCICYFYDNDKTNKKLYVGLDFEFNKNEIALWQISFYPKRKHKYIFVIGPEMLNSKYKQIVIQTVFTSKMHRILHGADSLDIPYIFNVLFEKNHEYFVDFMSTVYDTRFACEYIKIITSYIDKKCSLYDALLFFDVIDDSMYKQLNKTIGPVYLIHWNVSNMNIKQFKYALYDVLYLKQFYKNIFTYAKNNNVKLVYNIDKFHSFIKYGIFDFDRNAIDDMNNNMINDKNMNSIFNEIILEMKNIVDILNINNFKKTIMYSLKLIAYDILLDFKNDTLKMNKKQMYDNIEKYQLNELMSFFMVFENKIKIINT